VPFPGALKNDNEVAIEEETIVAAVETPEAEVAAEAPAVETAAAEAPAADAGEEKKEG
jgi:hypothetical protein